MSSPPLLQTPLNAYSTADMGEFALADIIDAPALKSLLGDFNALVPVPMAIIDVKGKVLVGVGWQDICTRFHRAHPESRRNCHEGDTKLSVDIPPGENRLYKCGNNMWDSATPIIVGGKRVGNLFIGQFFFSDEEPDRELFGEQARRYGFDEADYLAALDRVPRLNRETFDSVKAFFLKLAQTISQAGWSKVRLARSLADSSVREIELRRLNRTLKARVRSEQAMMRATDEEQYLSEVCRIIVEECGHAFVWIGFSETDKGKNIRPAAYAYGAKESTDASSDLVWTAARQGRGPTAIAMRTGRPFICRHGQASEELKPWCREAVKRGYLSSLALPLQREGKVFGAIKIYSKELDAFSEHETALLSGLADDLSYGISAVRLRVERVQAEKQLQQAQKMEAVGLLAEGIAHDFNNILAVIGGNNDLLLEGLKPGHRLRTHGLEIKHSAEVAATLTRQLLGISGNRGAQRRIVDPNSVILALSKMLRRLVGENIRLDLKLHPSVWSVRMDSGQLEQIVLNLSVNARDAMLGGGRLVLTTKNVCVDKVKCFALEVRDSGVGMDAAVQARIFEPFFSTKGPGRGTGLGLSTVASIVKEYQGHITVRSKPGRGSVFRICLPGVKGGVKTSSDGGHATARARGRERVLLVEDNASLLGLVKRTLQRAGYGVLTADSGEDAVLQSAQNKERVDLLLTDVVLPGIDGPEVAKRLKRQWPGMRTVYMSGYPGNALAPIADFGECVLLEKPFSLREMLVCLRGVLDREQGSFF